MTINEAQSDTTSVDAGYIPAAKVRLPQPRAALVPRPHLTARLNAALTAPLTLIAAPAGFGKTTLLSAWIQSVGAGNTKHASQTTSPLPDPRPPAPHVAWLALDSGDDDPIRFWRAVITAFDATLPGVGNSATALLSAPHAPIEPALVVLLNALDTWLHVDAAGAHCVLVIDDYHLITNRAIHDRLSLLLDQLPSQAHLVLAGRADPPLPLARLRARGQLVELRAADLKFTGDEAAVFIRDTMGLTLSATDLAVLEARTEGWAAGLQLAALALQGRADEPTFVTTFAGSHRYVFDYLVEEVLAQQTPDVQAFLLQSAVLERMCAEVCDAVIKPDVTLQEQQDDRSSLLLQAPSPTGLSSHQLLDTLERANLFLIPLDDERRWYRYHHLFGDLLRHQLARRRPGLAAILHRRAAAWYVRQGLLDSAVRHALQTDDPTYAATLIESAGRWLLQRGEFATLWQWLDALPVDLVVTRPPLALLRAWVLAWRYQPAAVADLLPPIEDRIADAPPDTRQPLAGEVAALQAFVARSRDDWPAAIRFSHRALAALPANATFARGFVAAGLGDLYWFAEDIRQATHFHTLALETGRASGDVMTVLDAVSSLGQFETLQGRLHAASAIYCDGIDTLARLGGWTQSFAALLRVGYGSIGYERRELTAARADVEAGIAQIERCGLHVFLPFAVIELARIAAAQGDAVTATDAAQRAARGIQHMIVNANGRTPIWATVFSFRQVEVELLLRRIDVAAQWAYHNWQPPRDDAPVPAILQQYALARVLLRSLCIGAVPELLRERVGERPLDLAHTWLSACLRRFSAWGLWGIVLEIYALQSTAYALSGAHDQALVALARALALGAPEGYVQPFVACGAPMAALLRQAHARGIAPEYTARLIQAFPTDHEMLRPLSNHAPARADTPITVEALSLREREVLALLANGLSHRDIAAALTIAPDTARTHIKNIYGKLQVQNRVQALAKARGLALI
jgi:LuxR family maltose regulon positive regulatory protein